MLSYKKLINLITDYRTTRTKSNEKIIDLTRITFFAFDIITRSSTQNFIFECNNSHTILRNAGTHTTSVPEDYSCRITVLKERSKMRIYCTTSWFANWSLWPQTCKTVGKYPCTGYSDQKSCGTQDYKRIEILFHTIFYLSSLHWIPPVELNQASKNPGSHFWAFVCDCAWSAKRSRSSSMVIQIGDLLFGS